MIFYTCIKNYTGDGLPVSRSTLNVVSWGGAFMQRGMPTVDFKFLCSTLFKRCEAERSRRAFYNVIVWAFAALLDGRFPSCDWEGVEYTEGTDEWVRSGAFLAGGLFCVIWNLKADNDWNANDLGLQHASARLMCPWCGANTCEDGARTCFN